MQPDPEGIATELAPGIAAGPVLCHSFRRAPGQRLAGHAISECASRLQEVCSAGRVPRERARAHFQSVRQIPTAFGLPRVASLFDHVRIRRMSDIAPRCGVDAPVPHDLTARHWVILEARRDIECEGQVFVDPRTVSGFVNSAKIGAGAPIFFSACFAERLGPVSRGIVEIRVCLWLKRPLDIAPAAQIESSAVGARPSGSAFENSASHVLHLLYRKVGKGKQPRRLGNR